MSISLFAGRGFSKLYKPYMADYGCHATTYFDFKRPKGLTVKFRDIVRRTYTPFLIALKNPANVEDFTAKVILKVLTHSNIFTDIFCILYFERVLKSKAKWFIAPSRTLYFSSDRHF